MLHPIGLQQHQALLDFFRADDFAGFEKLMCLHVTGTRDNYVNSLLARTAGGQALAEAAAAAT